MLARGSRRAAVEALARTGGNVVGPSLLIALANRSSILTRQPQQHRGLFSTSFAPAAVAVAIKAAPVDDVEPVPEEAKPAKPFADIQGLVSPKLYDALVGKPFRFTTMSTVQEAVLDLLPDLADPVRPDQARSGTDLLVKAKTGTGKTLAFLVPALEARLRDIQAVGQSFQEENPDASPAEVRRHVDAYRRKTTGVLILSPTRELATQIAQEAVRLCYHLRDLDVRLFVGGASKGFQLREWARGGRDVVVATPGRMIDVLDSEPEIGRHAETVKTLILDEADTLLEMGFRDEIDRIVSRLPPKDDRQTFLFSATVSRDIRSVANATMKKGRKFIDCVPEGESNVHEHVPQRCTVLPSPADQLPHIFRLLAHDQLSHPEGGKAIVFLPTTRLTQLFSQVLVRMKRELPWGQATRVYEIHGDRSQQQRTAASDAFRQQKDGHSILVTSDVSARGVDYPGVTRVIQVGIPSNRDIYIHRIGRTGRAGRVGRGDLVLLPWEARFRSSELYDLPISTLSVDEAKSELDLLARDRDESGAAPPVSTVAPLMKTGFSRRPSMPLPRRGTTEMSIPVRPRLSSFETSLETSVLPALDESLVHDAFASMIGFYLSKAEALNMRKMEVVKGLKDWATGGLKLEQEPYVSPAFLEKMGVRRDARGQAGGFGPGKREGKTFFRDGAGFERRPSFRRRDQDGDEAEGGFRSRGPSRSPWAGRGSFRPPSRRFDDGPRPNRRSDDDGGGGDLARPPRRDVEYSSLDRFTDRGSGEGRQR